MLSDTLQGLEQRWDRKELSSAELADKYLNSALVALSRGLSAYFTALELECSPVIVAGKEMTAGWLLSLLGSDPIAIFECLKQAELNDAALPTAVRCWVEDAIQHLQKARAWMKKASQNQGRPICEAQYYAAVCRSAATTVAADAAALTMLLSAYGPPPVDDHFEQIVKDATAAEARASEAETI